MKDLIPNERIEQAIFLIRGQRVMLDHDCCAPLEIWTGSIGQEGVWKLQ